MSKILKISVNPPLKTPAELAEADKKKKTEPTKKVETPKTEEKPDEQAAQDVQGQEPEIPQEGEFDPLQNTSKSQEAGDQKQESDAGKPKTHFAKDIRHMLSGKLPTDFMGHKIPTQKQFAQIKDALKDHVQDKAEDIKEGLQKLPSRFLKALPQKPSPQAYRALLNERFFSGALRGSPLHQKLQQETLPEQQATQGADIQESREALTRPEVLQLARMRSSAEEKDKFKQVLKYELAKIRQQQGKVQSIKHQTESGQEKKDIQKSDRTHLHQTQFKLLNKLQSSKTLSKFEQILQKMLDGAKIIPDLPEGVRAKFQLKSEEDWQTFFKNVAQQGSLPEKAKAELNKLIEALFRGTMTSEENGELQLIADLTFTEEGEVQENKFSRLSIQEKSLADGLKQLKPGDVISQDLLKQLGSEIDFVRLANLIQTANITEEQKLEFFKRLRQSHSTESQKKIESSLLSKRDDDAKRDRDAHDAALVWANQTFIEKQKFTGNPRFFMLAFYSISTIIGILILFMIFRALM